MQVIKQLSEEKFFAIIRINDVSQAYKRINELIEAGVKIFEIMIENYPQVELLEKLIKENKAYFIAGGIITERRALEAINIGVKTIISPIFQPSLIKMCQNYNVRVFTTATTPNEAYQAWKFRVPLIKIFPAKDMGAADYIRDILRPMPFLNVIATGSILAEEAVSYLEAGSFAVGIGRDLYENKSFEEIKETISKLKRDIIEFKASKE